MTEDNSAIVMGNEVGNVVWFDQKKGFGFIKVITPGSKYLNKEVFVHFSAIQSKNRFKKLYPGENVSLNIIKNTNQNGGSEKEFICSDISGLYGTSLLVDLENFLIKVIRRIDSNQEEN